MASRSLVRSTLAPPPPPPPDPARAPPPPPPLTPPPLAQILRVNAYGQASRGDANGALDDALSALEFKASSRAADGGGVAIGVGPAIQAFTDNEVIVSFCGHLTNVDYLAWRLFSPEGRRGDQMRQHHANPLEAASALVGGRCYEAELICHMYKTFGTKALPKLRGEFAFACFDARSVRVFAARDPSGTYPLLYGRDDDGTVVVANFDGAAEVLRRDRGEADDDETAEEGEERRGETPKLAPVPAGCFIYGHRGVAPQRYAKDELASKKAASAAADAAANALRGLRATRRSSVDGRRHSTDAGSRRESGDWSRGSKGSPGNSRLPWRERDRRGSVDGEEHRDRVAPLRAAAEPFKTTRRSLDAAAASAESEPPMSASARGARTARRGDRRPRYRRRAGREGGAQGGHRGRPREGGGCGGGGDGGDSQNRVGRQHGGQAGHGLVQRPPGPGEDAKPPTKPQQKNTTTDDEGRLRRRRTSRMRTPLAGASPRRAGFVRRDEGTRTRRTPSLASDAAASMAIHRVPSRSGNISAWSRWRASGTSAWPGRAREPQRPLARGAPGAGGRQEILEALRRIARRKPAGSPGGDDEPAEEEAANLPEDDASDEETGGHVAARHLQRRERRRRRGRARVDDREKMAKERIYTEHEKATT